MAPITPRDGSVRHICWKRLWLAVTLAIAQAGPALLGAAVEVRGSQLVLKSGLMEKTISLGGGRLVIPSWKVDGEEILTISRPPSRGFSLEISRANPNRRPEGMASGSVPPLPANQPDAHRLIGRGLFADNRPESVRWEDAVYLSGSGLAAYSGEISHQVSRPAPETVQIEIVIPLMKPEMLAGVQIVLSYELSEEFPVIRKKLTVINRGSHWLRLSRMLIADIEHGVAFNQPVPLSGRSLGVEACLIGYPSTDGRCGVIAGSEVPAGLRWMAESGAMGYSPDLFEWVIGPGESFASEPVFFLGFAGENIRTISGLSAPLDRAVEGALQRFLDRRVVLPAQSLPLIVPQWLTWASFEQNIDDATIRRQAGIAAKAGFAQLLIDDGWQKDRIGTEVDTRKFPDFAATSKYVRSLGLSLGLWVSAYRHADSPDLRDMPDGRVEPAIIRRQGSGPIESLSPRFMMSFASRWRDYYARDLVRVWRDFGVNYFKQDLTGIIYGDIAEGHESRTKKESLLRALRGLLASQDAIRRQAPEVVTELTHEIYWGTPGAPCDLAALKHAVQYHTPVNDSRGELPRRSAEARGITAESHRQQLLAGCYDVRQRFFAHRGLPLHRVEYYAIATQNFGGSLTPELQDRQIASMLVGAPLTFTGDLEWLTDDNIAHYRKRFDQLARLQRQYDIYRHFQYSGVPTPTDRDWHWWGKLNGNGMGIVVVLRGSGGAAIRAINVPWVERTRRYRVSALMAGRDLGVITGAQLQDEGVQLSLPLFGQEILEFASP